MAHTHTPSRTRSAAAPLAAALALLAACADAEPDGPFVGARLRADPRSDARRQADAWRAARPGDAALLDRIAATPQAHWLGTRGGDPRAEADSVAGAAAAEGALPVFVVYHIPQRDCGSGSAGGARDAAAYPAWVSAVAEGIGDRPAAVIVEPDALAAQDCLPVAGRAVREGLIRHAVAALKAKPRTVVYLDAGHPRWHPPAAIAERLRRAGIADADGFALNVSNFHTTADNLAYGARLSELLGGKRFVVDTSRNGRGPAPGNEWCNPPGRALGEHPTHATGHPRADAFLWIKTPGHSDGPCNGGPPAGGWWPEYALGLAQRASW